MTKNPTVWTLALGLVMAGACSLGLAAVAGATAPNTSGSGEVTETVSRGTPSDAFMMEAVVKSDGTLDRAPRPAELRAQERARDGTW